jgi:flavin-dependent dehydrogenase
MANFPSSKTVNSTIVIIGAGIAGATAFYYFSHFCQCILIEKNARPKRYYSAKILPKHTYPWIPAEIWKDPTKIFPREHKTSTYASRNHEAKIDCAEFDAPLGWVMDQYEYCEFCYAESLKKEGKIIWDTDVIEILHKNNGLLLKAKQSGNKNEFIELSADLAIMATGSASGDFLTALGFKRPEVFNTILAAFRGNSQNIEKNIPVDYIYRLHPQISSDGPFAMIRTNEYFILGYISKESKEQMAEKLIRIIKNYEPISGFFEGMQPTPDSITSDNLYFGTCAKYPIPEFCGDRILILGEAAGLVTPLYYEGVIGAMCSAKIAADLVYEILQKNGEFHKDALQEYQRRLWHNLKRYFKSGDAGEMLFLKSGASQQDIWDAYLKTIESISQVRKNVYFAYTTQNLADYPLENDEWVGELIFKNLPLSKKLLLTPLFLKVKFSN